MALPAVSEWASPAVFVPKENGCVRVFVGYRRLNAITERDSYPIPRMKEVIDSLGIANMFPQSAPTPAVGRSECTIKTMMK